MKNDRYIVEQEFEHAGYKCVVTFNAMGHRCGYVGIPKDHPLYGKEYSDYLEIKKVDVGDRKISGIFPLLGACLDKDEEYELKHIFNATEVLPLRMAEKIQAIRLKVIYGGLDLTVHIAMTRKNLNSLMRDFLITERALLCRLSVKIDFALMARWFAQKNMWQRSARS